MRPKPENEFCGKDGTTLKRCAWEWLLLVILGLVFAIWPSSVTGSSAERSIPFEARRSSKDSLVHQTGSTLPGRSPADHSKSALLTAQALRDPMEQQAAFKRCMEGLTPEMAASLLGEWNPQHLNGIAAQHLFDYWASAHPAEAAAWAQERMDPEIRKSLMNVAALRWAGTDLTGAVAWVHGLPYGDLRTEMVSAVGSEAIRSDPLEALRLAAELPSCQVQGDLVCRAAGEWASSDRINALVWAGQIQDENLKQQVTEQIVVASADQDPAGAAETVLEHMTPGHTQDRAIVSIVQRMTQINPAMASAWVSQFPNDSLGWDAMESLVNLWTVQDPAAPGDWLLTLPEDTLRNAGEVAYIRDLKRTNLESAERWTLSVKSTRKSNKASGFP